MVDGQAQDGETMELMVKFKVEGEDWCIVDIEGARAPGYDDKKEKRKEGGKVGEAYSAAMAPSPDTGGYGST
jgi:hypothetical protein